MSVERADVGGEFLRVSDLGLPLGYLAGADVAVALHILFVFPAVSLHTLIFVDRAENTRPTQRMGIIPFSLQTNRN